MKGRTIYAICGKWMPRARDYCARSAGHRDSCRTRYALDCQAEARRAA